MLIGEPSALDPNARLYAAVVNGSSIGLAVVYSDFIRSQLALFELDAAGGIEQGPMVIECAENITSPALEPTDDGYFVVWSGPDDETSVLSRLNIQSVSF